MHTKDNLYLVKFLPNSNKAQVWPMIDRERCMLHGVAVIYILQQSFGAATQCMLVGSANILG